MTAAAATQTDYWRPLIVLGALVALAVAVGQLWQLADRGDARGDMLEDPDAPGGVDWYPGHYVLPSGTNSDTGVGNIPWNELNSQIAQDNIRGVTLYTFWGVIEPTIGNYNWTPIDDAIAEANNRGLKVYINLHTKAFGNNARQKRACPSDFDDETECWFQDEDRGINCRPGESSGTPKHGAGWWNPQVMTAYKNFLTEFGARYNDNKTVALVSVMHETALAICDEAAQKTGYVVEAYEAGYNEVNRFASLEAFFNKPVVTYQNHWYRNIQTTFQAVSMANGVGHIQPDYYKPSAASAGQSYWPIMRNVVPITTNNERANQDRFGPLPSNKVTQALCPADGGVDCLNFVFWPAQWTESTNPGWDFQTGVLPAIDAAQSAGKFLNQTCPSKYVERGGCNTD